ncbi:hypothetical protein OEZ86_009608 [Tetradesmus obliquus]|uniref:Uncharacterized protein n=1 Tax=Tetradesmus obliquus TaxID=3088 RepID=A0ABY8UM69_TETOB|nr:hypothetical protein OEZ85_001052 [Tetradesmus obliquus]WIA43083.1 hypothetical protein OEZ86_009608 [Tetradesmus obliquus]
MHYEMRDRLAVWATISKGATLGLLPFGTRFTHYHFVFNSEDDYRFASKHWPQKFSAKAIPIHGDWVWSKIKIKQGWATHRIYFIRRRYDQFSKQGVVLGLLQQPATKEGVRPFFVADAIMKVSQMRLPGA